jgi:DNA ligase D-like protein (predicted ligase)
LWSRNQIRISNGYPELIEALAARGGPRFVADGEIVAFDGAQTSFAKLQARIHLTDPQRIAATGVDVFYYLFDLLAYDGFDLTGLPLRDRKRVLRAIFDYRDPLRYSVHRNTEGEAYYRHACERGWEGVIAKRADSTYRSGRSTDWLKFKCVREQEFVVGGFTDPQRSRVGLGAVLVGYYQQGKLRYAGKVGTGFDQRTLNLLGDKLERLERPTSPFDLGGPPRDAHWAKPELVAEIGFAEWTRDEKLRQPRYQGLRDDKSAREVVREVPS